MFNLFMFCVCVHTSLPFYPMSIFSCMRISRQILYSLCIGNYANILPVFQDVKVMERPKDERPIDDLLEYFNGSDGGNLPYF